jgi:hypothetical protein
LCKAADYAKQTAGLRKFISPATLCRSTALRISATFEGQICHNPHPAAITPWGHQAAGSEFDRQGFL